MANYPDAKLRKLAARDDEPIEDVVRRTVRELSSLSEEAVIELRLIGGENPDSVARFSVQLSPAGASLLAEHVENPALLAITTVETFRELVNGSYSPFSAHLDGGLNVRGNVDLGLKVFTPFAGAGVQVPRRPTPQGTQSVLCPTLFDPSYDPGGPDGGSFTISGEFFTDGGTVVIDFDAGGEGPYQQVVVANGNGGFTVTQPGITCGNIPGTDYGVSVTAYDQSSGLDTTQNYPTPC